MPPKLLLGCLRLVIALAMVLLALEALLRVLDPCGFHYAIDGAQMRVESSALDGLRVYNPGRYDYRGFSVTIQADHTRRTPDTNAAADCLIVMLGDSITLGHGVNDSQTFTNRLAQEFQQVRFVNTGFSGYNSHEVLTMYQRWPDADGYVYLILANDTHPSLPVEDRQYSYLLNYAAFALAWGPDFPDEWARFEADLAVLGRDPRVGMFSYGALARVDTSRVIALVQPTSTLSVMDGHPDAEGHRELAAQMRPYVEELLKKVCD